MFPVAGKLSCLTYVYPAIHTQVRCWSREREREKGREGGKERERERIKRRMRRRKAEESRGGREVR